MRRPIFVSSETHSYLKVALFNKCQSTIRRSIYVSLIVKHAPIRVRNKSVLSNEYKVAC